MERERSVRRSLRHSSLSLVFGLLFVLALAGQALAGWKQFNAEQAAGGYGQIGLGRYLTSADWAVDVAENWQSEYLQFTLYILLTVWLIQRGSPESKEPDMAGGETDEDQKIGHHAREDSPAWAKAGGFRTRLYSNSLVLVMVLIFAASWFIQSVAGEAAYNEKRLQDMQAPLSWGAYLAHADFWARTLQNWQSEFLAVGTMVVFSIYLRQRGSSQSKPVGEPHASTGVEG
jgi:hypothetical protein